MSAHHVRAHVCVCGAGKVDAGGQSSVILAVQALGINTQEFKRKATLTLSPVGGEFVVGIRNSPNLDDLNRVFRKGNSPNGAKQQPRICLLMEGIRVSCIYRS